MRTIFGCGILAVGMDHELGLIVPASLSRAYRSSMSQNPGCCLRIIHLRRYRQLCESKLSRFGGGFSRCPTALSCEGASMKRGTCGARSGSLRQARRQLQGFVRDYDLSKAPSAVTAFARVGERYCYPEARGLAVTALEMPREH